MRARAVLALGLAASLAAGCGWLVGVSGDVTLATDAGVDDEADGAELGDSASADGAQGADTAPPDDAGPDVDAESLEDGEGPPRDASFRDARDSGADARDD